MSESDRVLKCYVCRKDVKLHPETHPTMINVMCNKCFSLMHFESMRNFNNEVKYFSQKVFDTFGKHLKRESENKDMTNQNVKTKIPQIENMRSNQGHEVPNQFKIITDDGAFFKSYQSMIAFKPRQGKIQLDERKWDYSRTTLKYLCYFLECNTADIRQKIKDGLYELTDLNS